MVTRRAWNKEGGISLRLILPIASFTISRLLLLAAVTSVKGEVLDFFARLFGTF
ncbi:MAG: hypothetical protein GXX95_03955 [Methanomassiliicoccus sp.]|nr:hypothetical protein [Methanomassiliicoccus sp.]